MSNQKPVVLFLCAKNSIRSQIAEGLLKKMAGDRFEVHSAGLNPTEIHPLSRQVLEEIDVDTREFRAKSISEFLARTVVYYAVIVCGEGEGCPRLYPFAPVTLRWPHETPLLEDAGQEENLQRFRIYRDRVQSRIDAWIEEMDRAGSSAPATPGPRIGSRAPTGA